MTVNPSHESKEDSAPEKTKKDKSPRRDQGLASVSAMPNMTGIAGSFNGTVSFRDVTAVKGVIEHNYQALLNAAGVIAD